MRLTVKIIIGLFVLIILISGILQIEIERYKRKQIKEYGIIMNKQRLSYEPAIIYYLFAKNEKTRRASLLPYIEKDLKNFISKGLYDEYIVKCYYTDSEILNYLKIKKNNR